MRSVEGRVGIPLPHPQAEATPLPKTHLVIAGVSGPHTLLLDPLSL